MKYVESITVSPSSKIIKLDTWYQKAEATVCPCDADKPTVCWYSDDECVAAVNPTTGHIYGVSLGTARIYACACDGSGVQDYITVTVSSTVPVERITLNRSYISIEKDTSATLVASIFPEDATDKSLTWCSSNESVASVANGVVCGIKNGTATITATSSNGKSASCTVTVTGDILVSSITVVAPSKNMTVGDSAYFTASVLPINATKKSVCWSSENSNIASVNPDSGLVYAKAVGTTTIYATACDGGGAQGYFTVTVKEVVLAECLNLNPNKMTIAPGEEDLLIASIWPVWTTNTSVKWENSNPSVATIKTRTPANNTTAGLVAVTGNYQGTTTKTTTTITATAMDGSGKKDTCTVTVDPREKVVIEKDGEYFKVTFANGLVWKSIGRDMSLPDNNSDGIMWLPEEETTIFEHEKRGKHNSKNHYSAKQLALLYLLDPFGVEYYFYNYKTTEYNNRLEDPYEDNEYFALLRAYLYFKDEVYKEIFGIDPKPFTLSDSGQRVNITGNYDRKDVLTDSELIFGAHNIVDMVEWLETACDLLIELVDVILPETIKNKCIILGLNVAKELIFSGSIVEALSSVALDYLNDYIDTSIEESSNGTVNLMGWPNSLLDSVHDLLAGAEDLFKLSNLKNIVIYNRIENQDNYRVEFKNGSASLFVDEVIDLCK